MPLAIPPTGQPPSLLSLSHAAIGMGANLGADMAGKEAVLLAAWHGLHQQPHIQPLRLSSPYHSAPHDMQSNNCFVNAVALVATRLNPLNLLHFLLQLEAQHGRRRNPHAQGYQDRSLDLDLLFFDNLHIESEALTLPHPRMAGRLFVLAPLAELLPDWQHPVLHRSAAELCADLNALATQQVRRSQWNHR